MKILIVSGFLGAGKTTFIRRLSRNIGKRFVILENEYGAAGIDGARLGKDVAEEGNIWEMTEQCICCTQCPKPTLRFLAGSLTTGATTDS